MVSGDPIGIGTVGLPHVCVTRGHLDDLAVLSVRKVVHPRRPEQAAIPAGTPRSRRTDEGVASTLGVTRTWRASSLDAEVRHPSPQPFRQPPVRPPHHRHHAWDEHETDDKRIDEDRGS